MNAVTNQEHRLPALQSGGAVRAIVPQDFDGAWRIALAVTKAGMAPKGLETPEKAMVAIMHGLEVGFTPMAALQSIAVINSRATVWGDGALALVQASGKLESHKEWFEGSGDTRKAYCRVVRRGDPEPKLGEFSVADAKTAGLWGKKGRDGSPTPWITYPDRMLKMRARGFALRDGFSDVLKGLGIAEEVQDVELAQQISIAPPQPPRPPAPPQEKIADHHEVVDAETGEVVETTLIDESAVQDNGELVDETAETLGDYFSKMEEAMELATSAAEIAETWNDFDPLAKFEGDDDNQALAMMIKRKHIQRVGTK